MTAKDDRKNAEGYNDPTAYNAIKNVEQEQDKDDVRFHQLLNTLFSLCELAELQIGTGFWSGNYAMVQKDGEITKVPLNRVYDVKESL